MYRHAHTLYDFNLNGVCNSKQIDPGVKNYLISITRTISKIFIPNFVKVLLQIKDIKHINRDFCSDAWVIPLGWNLDAQGLIFGDGCLHPASSLTLTVFQSRQFFTLARPYIICYTPCKFSII